MALLAAGGGRREVPCDEDGRLAESCGHVDEVQALALLRGTAAEVNVLVMTRGRDRGGGKRVVSWADAFDAEQEER